MATSLSWHQADGRDNDKIMAILSDRENVMASRVELHGRLLDLEREFGDEELVDALMTLLSSRGHGPEAFLDGIATVWSARESKLLDAAASLAARHHALEGDESQLRGWLALLALQSDLAMQLGGEPRRVLDEVGQTVMAQARLRGEAIQTIWEEPMLEPRDAAVALGAKKTNREKVRQYRGRSWLLGLPSGRGYLYPAFQFDPQRRNVFGEVRAVNERLEAERDPWGVASWWISTNGRLGGRPVEFVGTDRSDDLVAVAGTVTELVG